MYNTSMMSDSPIEGWMKEGGRNEYAMMSKIIQRSGASDIRPSDFPQLERCTETSEN